MALGRNSLALRRDPVGVLQPFAFPRVLSSSSGYDIPDPRDRPLPEMPLEPEEPNEAQPGDIMFGQGGPHLPLPEFPDVDTDTGVPDIESLMGNWPGASFQSVFPQGGGWLEGLQQLFQMLLTNPGIPADVMKRAQSFSRGELLAQERRRIQRRSSEFSGRGMFGSGVHAGDIRGIEADTETEIGRSSTALSLEDARLGVEGRRTAASLGLGIGNMGLDIDRLNLAGMLGFGDLDLRKLALMIQKELDDARINIDIRRWFLPNEEDSIGSGGSEFNFGDAFSGVDGSGGIFDGLGSGQGSGQGGVLDWLESLMGGRS